MGAIVSMLGGVGRVESLETKSRPGSRATPFAHNEKRAEAATRELVWLITGDSFGVLVGIRDHY